MVENEVIRNILFSNEFKEFRDSLDNRVQIKIDEAVEILRTVHILSAKFIKKLVNTDFYEMRVTVGYSEYRTVLFSVDHSNIVQSTRIILLNGFLKKSSKDYNTHIKKAINIIKDLES